MPKLTPKFIKDKIVDVDEHTKQIYNYLIEDTGKIYSLTIKNYIKKQPHNGYEWIHLSDHRRREGFSVHRLVAEAFLPRTEDQLYVLHKNNIKNDNRVENLEWATWEEFQQKSKWKKYNISQTRQKACLLNGVRYPSIAKALRSLGYKVTNGNGAASKRLIEKGKLIILEE